MKDRNDKGNNEISDHSASFLIEDNPEFIPLIDQMKSMELFEIEIFNAAQTQGLSGNTLEENLELAKAIKHWPVAPDVCTDADLGKYLYENDMLDRADFDQIEKFIRSTLRGRVFAQIGKSHREENRGFYSPVGYVEPQGFPKKLFINKQLLLNKQKTPKQPV